VSDGFYHFSPPVRRSDRALRAFGEQTQTIGVSPQFFNHIATTPPEDRLLVETHVLEGKMGGPPKYGSGLLALIDGELSALK